MSAVVGVSTKKIMYNRLVQDGRLLAGLDEDGESRILEIIDDLPCVSLSEVLADVSFLPVVNGAQKGSLTPAPVLRANEEIVASCFDDNYYTFATSSDAANRMYEDNEPIKNLRRMLEEEPSHELVADLTLVRGNRLLWRNQSLESLADRKNEQVPSEVVRSLAEKSVASVRRAVDRITKGDLPLILPQSYIEIVRDDLLDSIGDAIRPLTVG
ncbi:MAG: hypothetical protein AAGJ35_12935 [Myxococcota bacterium]